MNYTKAHWWMAALLVVTFIAFWPSYFGVFSSASIAHHLHGTTGTLWILLIAWQSYMAHKGNLALHRSTGKALFILVPAMVGAFALVSLVGAVKAATGHPFYERFGLALLTADGLLTFIVPFTIYLALRYRRRVQLHSALMISSVIGLLPPVLSRFFIIVIPGWQITTPEQLYKFAWGLHTSMVATIALALVLYFRYRPHGWPWLLAAGFTGFYYSLYLTLGQTDFWRAAMAEFAGLSPVLVFVFGALLGASACWLGWKHGKTR